MGIHDRDYYRGETQGSLWLSGQAPACKAIIAINVVMLILQSMQGPERPIEHWFAATSEGIFEHGYVWQLLTATFLHGTVLHLFWNMLFLWMVGRDMEALYGTRNFVALYLSAGVVSTLGWAAMDHFSGGHMLGASGAVMAVIVVYALYHPRREVLFFMVLPVEMWLLVTIYILSDAWSLLVSDRHGQIAVASHLSGAAYGYLYKRLDLRWTRLVSARFNRPRLRVVMPDPRDKVAPRPATSSPTWSSTPPTAAKPASTAVLPQEQLDAKLDEVLAKIAREGPQQLTEEENRVLQEASRRARSRRSDRL
ncbi:MAG: rhomboid family intramembrane serine protease [Isosphaeraceae bacterium]|nr:rhomboid family intramembrane serine protease [Isosphaeraceae bacterium]